MAGIDFKAGFNTASSAKLSLEEAEKTFKIKSEDFKHVDTNKDGFIDMGEFLSGGLTSPIITSAFKQIAGNDYNENFKDISFSNNEQADTFKKLGSDFKPNQTKTKQTNPFTQNNTSNIAKNLGASSSNTTKPVISNDFQKMFTLSEYSPTHPNISGNGFLAKRLDIIA